MSYSSYYELPPQVRKSFSREDGERWMELYNESEKSALKNKDIKIDQEVFKHAYYEAWKGMKNADSSRSFVAQVAIEDVDVWNDMPMVDEYLRDAYSIVDEGGIGTDSHSSKHVWCIWDMVRGLDKDGKDSIVVQGNFFRDRVAFDYSWNKFLKGTSQFSLGSYADSKRVCDNFKCYNKVHPVHLFEISIVDIGASPNTGVISVHVPEGEGEFNPKNVVEGTTCILKSGEKKEFCIKEVVYDGLKEDLKGILGEKVQDEKAVWGYEYLTHMGICITVPNSTLEEVWPVISGWAEGVYFVAPPVSNNPLNLEEISNEVGASVILLIPYDAFTSFDNVTISALITDEQEAIRAYDIAIVEAQELFGEASTDAIEMLTHIRDEEYEHIYELLELMMMHNYAVISQGESDKGGRIRLYLKNRKGSMEGVGSCPPGQHYHPGINGCHDVMRVHTDLISSNPEGKVDLTNEQIDVNLIKEMSTTKLKAVVLTIVKVMSKFSDEKIAEFMQTSGGKEFVLMFSELVNRSKKGGSMDGDMNNIELKEKSLIDPVTDYSALLTVIADLKTKVEHLTSLVLNTKGSILANQENSGNIADAVSTAVESLGSPEAEDGGSAVGNADGGHTTITEGKEEIGTEGDFAQPDKEGGPIASPDNVSADETIPGVSEEVEVDEESDEEEESGESEEGEDEPEPEGEGDEESDEGEEEESDEGDEKDKGKKKKKKEGDNMSDEVKKNVEEKTKSGEPSTEVEPEVKEKTGEAGVGGEPGITETLGEGKGEDGGEEGEAQVKEAGGDAFASIQVTPDENDAGIIGEGIPEIACDAPETNDGTPSIDLSGAGEQEDSDGVGVSPNGEPKGAGESTNIDPNGGKPAEIGAGETLKAGGGIPAENVLPTEIPKGPNETLLEQVSKTEPYTRDSATWERGVNWDTGIDSWLNNSKELLKSGGSIERDVNPLETKVHYKSGGDDVIVVTPENTSEGTGIKLSEGGIAGRNFEALWSAIGKDEETFKKIKEEVLR